MEQPAPSIRNLLDSKTLRWIFVGGKGGVGKTTCSCCIAAQLAKVRDKVLIISTDPAHNLSDAFNQKFSGSPTKVNGIENLYAMEIDPGLNLSGLELEASESEGSDIKRLLTQVLTSAPGIDEYLSYLEVFRLVRSMEYSVVVFDTAPTGHTLRLLAFPETMENGLTKLVAMKDRIMPIANQLMGFFGGEEIGSNDINHALESRLPIVREITNQFKNSSQTTFVCVCIPEFLSMYETERLVQELNAHEVDVRNIIINQILFPNLVIPHRSVDDESDPNYVIPPVSDPCKRCVARHRVQSKYLEQLLELYDEMHVVQLPQMDEEIRGFQALQAFSEYLLKPSLNPSS